MTFRRLLFTYGLLAMIAGMFLAVRTAVFNSYLITVPATVTELTQEPVTRQYSDGTLEEDMMDVVIAEYEYNGIKDESHVISPWTKGMSDKQIEKLKPGDKVEFYFDPAIGSVKAPDSYTLAIIQCSLAAVMIYLGKNGRKGYKAEFFDRYKPAFIYTCFASGVSLGYAIYEEFIFVGGGMMPGLAELGKYIFLLMIMAAALVSEIVFWAVSVRKYTKKEKALNEQQ